MLFFIICIVLIIVGAVFLKKFLGTFIFALGIAGVLLIVLLTSSVIINNNCVKIQKQIERENYIAVLESEIYKDKLDINDVEIIKEIQEFNKDIRMGKIYNKSLWIGWFIEDCYEDIEEIDLSKYLKKSEQK